MTQPPPNSSLLSIPSLGSKLILSSRWEHSDNGTIWSAWAGASIKFYSPNLLSSLFVRFGSKTERKDRWNGGTPMFAVTVTKPVSPNDAVETDAVESKTFDGAPGMLVRLWDEPIQECYVEITLIDWASVLEIDAFICPDPTYVNRDPMASRHQMLFIGDSVTCGLALEPSDGGQPIPRGILDAFPSRAISILSEKYSYPLSPGFVAYPGISLVALEAHGMINRFFHTSPWDSTPWNPRGNPKLICIALGTNDEANEVVPTLFRSALEGFIRRLSVTFPSVKAFYVIPPFRDFNEPDAGAIYADLVSNPLLDLDEIDVKVFSDIGSGMTAEHTVDGLHPTLAGHQHLAENLAQYLALHCSPPEPEGKVIQHIFQTDLSRVRS
ncbi:hypothetical protein DFH09DRAFT_573596 [Mycena vulgaris]|nr:hypothetical protein DFH09DRAFT_573596 [Mycena vulgaris]